MSNVEIKNIQNIDAFKNIRDQWSQLLAVSSVQSTFLTWEWLYNWWKTNNTGRELWLLTAWRDNKLVGIAPLMQETRRKFGVDLNTIVNLGTPQNDVGGFLFNKDDPEVPLHLIKYLISNRNKWDILEFNELKFHGTEQNIMETQFQESGFLWREEKNIHYFITLEDSWGEFETRLARKFRYNLRRALRLAGEIGQVEIRSFSGDEATWDVFQTIIDINFHANHPRLCHSESEQALIKALTEQTTPNHGWLEAYILFVNNQAVAYEYGFAHDGRFEDWRSGFDTRFPPNVSIGKVLAMQVIQKCIEKSYKEIDFLRGDEEYKQEWLPSEREFVNIRVFNNQKPRAAFAYYWLEKIKPLITSKKD